MRTPKIDPVVCLINDNKSIRNILLSCPRVLGVLNSIDQLPKEASNGDMYIVSEHTKINVHGDMTDVRTDTTYVCASNVWFEYQKETFLGEEAL